MRIWNRPRFGHRRLPPWISGALLLTRVWSQRTMCVRWRRWRNGWKGQMGEAFGVYIPSPEESLVDSVCFGRADFAVVGTVSYLQAHQQCGAQILVRGLNADGKDTYRAASDVGEGIAPIADTGGEAEKLLVGGIASERTTAQRTAGAFPCGARRGTSAHCARTARRHRAIAQRDAVRLEGGGNCAHFSWGRRAASLSGSNLPPAWRPARNL